MFQNQHEVVALALAFLLVVALVWASRKRSTATRIRVTDGDGVVIDGQTCRLFGIDAPELGFADGRRARVVLETMLSHASQQGRKIQYRVKGHCRYGRPLVILYVGRRDLNALMVRKGYARAYLRYSKAYLFDQIIAVITRRGLWSGGFFLHPERTRHGS